MVPARRRDLLASAGATAGALAGCLDLDLGFGRDSDANDDQSVALDVVASGFGAPADVAFRPDDDEPYVVDQTGRIYRGDASDDAVVADLRDRIVELGEGYTERGLLGLAFHPDGDRAYVRYSAPAREGTPEEFSHTFVLSEFPVTDVDSTDGDGDGSGDSDGEGSGGGGGEFVVDEERTLLEIPEPQSNHNSGDVAFGPEGFLYVAVGDGGGAGDRGRGHVEDWYDENAGGNGQDVVSNLRGSILRIDVDSRPDGEPYGIPDDNPLVDEEGLAEHYAWGFRNPWGMAFDDDRFVVADVGQNEYEEVNVVEAGGNYGWNVREGRHCFDAEDCPTETPEGDPLIDPVLEYDHDVGIAIVGGHVYRGSDAPALEGRYVFGDWRGGLFVADPEGDGWDWEALAVADGFERNVLAFGQDHDGEMYVASDADGGPTGDAGRVSRFVRAEGGDDGAETTSEPDETEGGDGTTTDDAGTDASASDGDDEQAEDAGTTAISGEEQAADQQGDATPGFGVVVTLLGGATALGSRLRRRRD